MSRGFKINRHSYDYAASERVDWLDSFADKIEEASQTTAVEVARQRSQVTMHDQISSIMMGGTPSSSYATVDDAVRDMQERTGLGEYLKRVSNKLKADKTASEIASEIDGKLEECDNLAENSAFKDLSPKLKESIINYCMNKISTHRGQVTVPDVQHDVLMTFKSSGLQPQDVNCEPVARLISGMILKEQQTSPAKDENNLNMGLGVGRDDIDPNDSDNQDWMKLMTPSD